MTFPGTAGFLLRYPPVGTGVTVALAGDTPSAELYAISVYDACASQ